MPHKSFQKIFIYLLLTINSCVLYAAHYSLYNYGKLNNQIYITIESPTPFLTMKYVTQATNCGGSLYEEENIINLTHYKVPCCITVKKTPNLTSCIVFMNRNSQEKEITVIANDFDTLIVGNLKDNQISIQKKAINKLEQVARFTFTSSK